MEAMSGGDAFLEECYLFLAAEDWLLAIGYPLDGEYSQAAFQQALDRALNKTQARRCWAISPCLPEKLKNHCAVRDHYFVLSTTSRVPTRLERQASKAEALLQVELNNVFTPGHRELWNEFLGRVSLPPNVRELYVRTEQVVSKTPGIFFINAYDLKGCLVASYLLDISPHRFTSYIIGARSLRNSLPHASDLLFLKMMEISHQHGKEFLHLGLGVNDGIRRFKTKWRAVPQIPYEMAAWEEPQNASKPSKFFLRAISSLSSVSDGPRRSPFTLPTQKPYKMIWKIEKHGRNSWIGGTAHFFCYSFERSFRRLFKTVETIIFEGPLDQVSLERISAVGRTPDPAGPRLVDFMKPDDICLLEKVLREPQGFWARFLGIQSTDNIDVQYFLSQTRPWMAFFSIWTCYLARHGWRQSVDLEAWRLAEEMGKTVRWMETLDEQIETLESIPIERIVNFFRRCQQWHRYLKRNVKAYLKGDLERMMGTSIEFPSRTEQVIHHRDLRFMERMHPFLEHGRCAVLVGTAHLDNLLKMLVERGFEVSRFR